MTSTGLARCREAAARYFHTAPGTTLYLFSLAVTSLVVRTSSPRLVSRLLRQESTNLFNMGHHPAKVIVASAFLIESGTVVPWLVGFGLVLAPAERWLGTARWLIVFAAGHVGATLITLAGIWRMTHGARTDLALVHSVDVGISYGFYAVAAALVYRLPRTWRAVYAGALVSNLAVIAVANHEFADVGHLCAVSIGLAAYPLLRSRVRGERRVVDNERALRDLTGGAVVVSWAIWRHHATAIWATLLLVSAPVAGAGVALLTSGTRPALGLIVVAITAAAVTVIVWLNSRSQAPS